MTQPSRPPRRPFAHRPRAGDARRPARGRGWAGFVSRFGWRAYALPILTVITIVALTHGSNSSAAHGAGDAGDQVAAPPPVAAPATLRAGASGHVQMEGLAASDAGFQAGTTPAPVVINLGSDVTSCATNSYPELLLVSISKQHMWACEGGRQIRQSPVTTGNVLDHDQTPLGSWRVQAKQRDRYLVGPGYKDYVHYWVPFNGDFGLHDASWQTMPFGSPDWRTQGSHGCVHTPNPTMAWIYRWVHVGSTVVTIES